MLTLAVEVGQRRHAGKPRALAYEIPFAAPG